MALLETDDVDEIAAHFLRLPWSTQKSQSLIPIRTWTGEVLSADDAQGFTPLLTKYRHFTNYCPDSLPAE